MKILIVEDEAPAADRLQQMIRKVIPHSEILGVLDNVESSVQSMRSRPAPELIFMDIQLADGLSFSIFKKVEVPAPVIFTTAFNQYMLDAFKVNSIDYLLKPIAEEELVKAYEKYSWLQRSFQPLSQQVIESLIADLSKPSFKQRWLVKVGKELTYIPTHDVHYFYAEDGLTFLMTRQKQRCIVDYTIDQIEECLDPQQFHRVSRKYIVHINAIHKIQTYFSGRLILGLDPLPDGEVTVSRDRVAAFKSWLDN